MKEKISLSTQKALNVWAVVLILWSIYRANFKTDLPIWFDECIMKPVFFILPVYWYIHKIEKKNFVKSINLHIKSLLGDIILGLLLGAIFFAVGYFGASLRSGGASVSKLINTQSVFLLFISFATSISEEILSRGFVLKHLYDESKNAFSAIFFSSVLFFFLHIPMLFTSIHITGGLLLKVILTDMFLSIAVSILYLQRKSLILPIIVHAFYSLSLSFFL